MSQELEVLILRAEKKVLLEHAQQVEDQLAALKVAGDMCSFDYAVDTRNKHLQILDLKLREAGRVASAAYRELEAERERARAKAEESAVSEASSEG